MANVKDYKKIAEILKKHFEVITNCALFSNADIQIFKNAFVKLVNSFADYFEKEDKKEFMEKCDKAGTHKLLTFNRKQFLEWCGVEWMKSFDDLTDVQKRIYRDLMQYFGSRTMSKYDLLVALGVLLNDFKYRYKKI